MATVPVTLIQAPDSHRFDSDFSSSLSLRLNEFPRFQFYFGHVRRSALMPLSLCLLQRTIPDLREHRAFPGFPVHT